MGAEDNGPINIRNQFPPDLFFLFPTFESARILEPGELEVGTSAVYSSVLDREVEGTALLFMDMEVLRWTLKGRWGVWDRLDTDVEIPFLYFTGGFLDPLIKAFHNVFGFSQGGRDEVPDNQFRYDTIVDGAPLYHVAKPGRFAISDMVLNARYRLHSDEGRWPAIVLKASVKLPTGSSAGGFGSGHLDYGGSLLIEKDWARFSAYGNIGAVIPGSLAGANPSLETQPFAVGAVAGEYRFTDWVSLVLQLDANTTPYARAPFQLLRKHAIEIGGGFRFKAWGHGSLELGFVDGFGSVPDFTTSLSAKWLL